MRAALLQQGAGKGQEGAPRRAKGGVCGVKCQLLQAGVRSRGVEARAKEHAAVRKAQAAQAREPRQAAQGLDAEAAPNLFITHSLPPEVQRLESGERDHALGQPLNTAVGQVEGGQAGHRS